MKGDLDFTDSLKRRVSLLKGTSVSIFAQVKERISFTPGARDLTRILKLLGFELAVVSGGFIPLAEYVKHELGLDHAHANTLQVSSDGQTLTGNTVGVIVDGERKKEVLLSLAGSLKIHKDQVRLFF